MKSFLIPVFVGLATLTVGAAERPSVVTSATPMRRLAEGVVFKGESLSVVNPPFLLQVPVAGAVFARHSSHDGLIEERTASHEFTLYRPFDLAIQAGWFKSGAKTSLPNGVRGVVRSGDSIWMGTDGVGILEYDFVRRTWSRHDLNPTPIPGRHSQICYGDADYVFASGLSVYSTRERRWIRIDAISTKNAVLGHSPEGALISMPWDYRRFASAEYIPLGGDSGARLWSPDRITYDDASGEYVLEYNTEWKEAGAATKLRFSKRDLSKGFASSAGTTSSAASGAMKVDANALKWGEPAGGLHMAVIAQPEAGFIHWWLRNATTDTITYNRYFLGYWGSTGIEYHSAAGWIPLSRVKNEMRTYKSAGPSGHDTVRLEALRVLGSQGADWTDARFGPAVSETKDGRLSGWSRGPRTGLPIPAPLGATLMTDIGDFEWPEEALTSSCEIRVFQGLSGPGHDAPITIRSLPVPVEGRAIRALLAKLYPDKNKPGA